MNKNQFVEFHRLLAILKYELYMNLCETNNEKYIAELQKQLDAIDILMAMFVVEKKVVKDE